MTRRHTAARARSSALAPGLFRADQGHPRRRRARHASSSAWRLLPPPERAPPRARAQPARGDRAGESRTRSPRWSATSNTTWPSCARAITAPAVPQSLEACPARRGRDGTRVVAGRVGERATADDGLAGITFASPIFFDSRRPRCEIIGRRGQHAGTGTSASATAGSRYKGQRRLQRGERALVGLKARASWLAVIEAMALRTHDDSGLRAARACRGEHHHRASGHAGLDRARR